MRFSPTGLIGAVALAVSLVAGTAAAQEGGRGGGGRGGGPPAPMKINIPGFPDGGVIPLKYANVNAPTGSVSPAIEWSGVPASAVTIALIFHDADVASRPSASTLPGASADDTLHWAIFNIPATATGLPEGVPHNVNLDDGSVQIKYADGVPRLAIGVTGYFGPSPPPGAPHHYVFDFFALDTKLDPSINSREDLVKAMSGHVRAKGVYFGTYTSPPRAR
ncbi:MAG: YbhB/YbcL family Raf kinase inhibitor-like protein [Bryobacteraceae bacterium]|jgi:Raf kinase inhibitor-like YbhB/YbcL family protein